MSAAWGGPVFDPVRGREIALAYDELRTFVQAVNTAEYQNTRCAWDALREDEVRLFTRASKTYHIQPWPAEGQPYASSAAMREDVRQRRHLFVFMGGGPHAYLSEDDTYRGRAVHDIYAHALPGHSFSPDGELRAWLVQREMYGMLAQPALATDNLGPTAWYYFHPSNEGKPHAERQWPEQKFGLLPRELWGDL